MCKSFFNESKQVTVQLDMRKLFASWKAPPVLILQVVVGGILRVPFLNYKGIGKELWVAVVGHSTRTKYIN